MIHIDRNLFLKIYWWRDMIWCFVCLLLWFTLSVIVLIFIIILWFWFQERSHIKFALVVTFHLCPEGFLFYIRLKDKVISNKSSLYNEVMILMTIVVLEKERAVLTGFLLCLFVWIVVSRVLSFFKFAHQHVRVNTWKLLSCSLWSCSRLLRPGYAWCSNGIRTFVCIGLA